MLQPVERRKDPRRVAAGKKAAARRAERLEFQSQNIPPDLRDVWEKMKTKIKPPPGQELWEAFMEWAEMNPDEIGAMRSASQTRQGRAIKSLQAHCLRVGARAEVDYFQPPVGAFSEDVSEELSECADGADPGYEPGQFADYLESAEVPF